MIIDDKIQDLLNFKSSIFEVIASEIVSNKHIIIDMNAYIQLYEGGVNAEGIRIDSFKPYTSKTIQIKQSKGQPTDRVTLRDKGDFHRSFDIIVLDDRFLITATDEKTEMLITKYGEDILGLTDNNVNQIIWDYIYEALILKRNSLL